MAGNTVRLLTRDTCWMTTSLDGIKRVLVVVPDIQVRRVAARRVITTMASDFTGPFKRFATHETKQPTVRHVEVPVNAKTAVALCVPPSPCPRPARIRAAAPINQCPESVDLRFRHTFILIDWSQLSAD
jgi:hypothetical protein